MTIPELIEELYMIQQMINALDYPHNEESIRDLEFNKLIDRRKEVAKKFFNYMGNLD